jgi:hypothetical protein
MITVQKTRKNILNGLDQFGMWTVLYWTRSSRTQFGMLIHVWRLAGDSLNITCNFLYCNHQVHRDFLITLYFAAVYRPLPEIGMSAPVTADRGRPRVAWTPDLEEQRMKVNVTDGQVSPTDKRWQPSLLFTWPFGRTPWAADVTLPFATYLLITHHGTITVWSLFS